MKKIPGLTREKTVNVLGGTGAIVMGYLTLLGISEAPTDTVNLIEKANPMVQAFYSLLPFIGFAAVFILMVVINWELIRSWAGWVSTRTFRRTKTSIHPANESTAKEDGKIEPKDSNDDYIILKKYRRLADDVECEWASKEELKSDVIVRRAVNIYDLLDDQLHKVIQKKTFIECDLVGPVVLAPIARCAIMNCTMIQDSHGDIDSLLWERQKEDLVGAVLLRDSTMDRCRFIDVGFAGTSQFLDTFRTGTELSQGN